MIRQTNEDIIRSLEDTEPEYSEEEVEYLREIMDLEYLEILEIERLDWND